MAIDRYTIELENFGKRLRFIRKNAKLTQYDLEAMTNISRADISRIENGLKNFEFSTIIKLAEALNIELIEFFKKENP